MCLVAFAWQVHPRYHLILAANRDEFHNRPAQAMHWWPDRPALLAGRDLEAGGTWLGISRSGRFAAVTNYREDLQRHHRGRSRGELVTNFVAGTEPPVTYCSAIDPVDFAGFSLLAMSGDELAYMSNRGDEPRRLSPDIYGLSNASLDTPWHKVVRSKAALAAVLQREDAVEPLFRMLRDAEPAADDYAGMGLAPELARAVSAPFISTPDYGTRCSTVVTIATSGIIEVQERRFDSSGMLAGEACFEFEVGSYQRP